MIRKFNIVALDRLAPWLKAIIQIFPDARIAGGFIRDTLLNISPRDVDVLVGSASTEQLQDLGRLLADNPALMQKHELLEDAGYLPDPTRASHIVELWQGGGVDIIVADDVETHFQEFPDNISRVFFDKSGLCFGEGFVEGHTEKRIVYRDAAGPPRLLKLIAKFPDYAVTHV
jgi:hypothetical protein